MRFSYVIGLCCSLIVIVSSHEYLFAFDTFEPFEAAVELLAFNQKNLVHRFKIPK
jgi:hypothetical protein